MDSPKYNNFNISEVAYKVIKGQKINAYVLIPKSINPGLHPVVVKFHGGGFITGDALYPDWYPQWALSLALLHNAIIVTPNYRLLPEATPAEMLSDVTSFWSWLYSSLPSVISDLSPDVQLELDFEKILVHGESAGGTLAMISGYTQKIAAVIATYPSITLTRPPSPPDGVTQALLDAQAANPERIVSSVFPPLRLDLAENEWNRHWERSYGADGRETYLGRYLDKLDVDRVPYTLVLHGDADENVRIESTLDWVKRLQEKLGEAELAKKWDLRIEQGAGHGFDVDIPFDTPWLQEKLERVTDVWLRRS